MSRLPAQPRTAANTQPTESGDPGTDPATLAELATEVDRLDPTKPIDRRAAHIMLGRVPVQIDRLLAEKFGTDPQFAEKLHTVYPEGLPEADAATWRSRAHGDEQDAAAALAVPDDPHTPQREDEQARTAAARGLGLAARQHGIATAVAGQRPVVVRRTEPLPAGPQRRA